MANAATEAHGPDDAHDAHDAHGHHGPEWLQHHFDTPQQQFDAAKFGMWLFIVTEILMFGGLFVAYFIFKGMEPQIFHEASQELNKKLGAANTVVLLFSSLTAALAVRASQLGRKNETTGWLVLTLLCAGAFLVVKYFEYTHKLHEGFLPGQCFGFEWCDRSMHQGRYLHLAHHAPHEVPGHPLHMAQHALTAQVLPPRAHMFFAVYFMTTGLHALHILVGMSVLTWVLVKNLRGKISKEYFTPVEIGALYWHLVDLVWIYLFPLLYLVG